jgi:CRP-like cAMP-binding protein
MSAPNLRTAQGNRLLAALPRTALERILPDLDLKPLEMRQVVQPRKKSLSEVIFPLNGVASMISMGDAGDSVEVATIGCEGFVGMPLFLGGTAAAVEVFIQVPGHGLCLSSAAFERHVKREPALLRTLLLYTQALLTQVAQSSACNRHHPVEQRCARWLLQTHDRVRGNQFPLTQDFLSLMLGVRRASVTETAAVLQERDLIRYRRGQITVLDRVGLERASCDCYRLIAREFDRLLPSPRKIVRRAKSTR